MRKKKMNQPLSKGVARVPVIMQLEMLECGAACFAMIMGYYGKWITLEQARVDCGVSRDGSSAKNIMRAARGYGMKVHAYKLEPEALLKEGPFPCMIHWGFNHFVVLDGFHGNKAVLNDPARGRIVVSWEEFDREFTGVCMTMAPGADFVPEGARKNVWKYAGERIKGTGSSTIFVALTTVIIAFLGILQPIFNQIFLDRLLTGTNKDWLFGFLVVLGVYSGVLVLMSWINAIYGLKIQGKISAVGNSSYLWKILRLPMQFFDQRLPGDLVERQSTNASIAGDLVNTFGPLVINSWMMVFYLVLMLRRSLFLTLIGVGALAINLLVSGWISQRRVNIQRVQMRDQSKFSSAVVTGIDMIETIKASGVEKGYFARLSGYQASVNEGETRFAKFNQWLEIIPRLCGALANLAVLGYGMDLVLNGEMTLGMIMAFQGFLNAFTAPATSMVSAGQSLQEMLTQMERVDDVMNYENDAWFQEREIIDRQEKLSGQIELKNVTFGYSRFAAPVIENFSMKVNAGEKIAIVGASGCGKSTLVKLLTGLSNAWSGEILFDGIEISKMDRDIFTASVSVVDQEVILFDDTIANNISMWDDTMEDGDIITAAKDAQIHEDIRKAGGYQNKIQEEGRDLSGGQRQRLEIARALAKNPSICILDEATSALDAKTEYEVVNAISKRGITCIVVAHRLSTIRDCDEIIVLDQGQIVESGTHEELMKLDGFYKLLITSD